MATVKVVFPDGGAREVAATKRLDIVKKGKRRDRVLLVEPVADPRWRFVSMIGGWRAFPSAQTRDDGTS